jgi:hypothetical protein
LASSTLQNASAADPKTFGTLLPSFDLHMQEPAELDRDQRMHNFRSIFKGLVRFASVALIAAMVQASLISAPSAQTTSAENARETQGSSPSEKVEQIEGTYEGTFTINQLTGEHQISLTFQQSGSEVTVTYRSALGGRGSGKSIIAGNTIATVPLQSEPNCPGLFTVL